MENEANLQDDHDGGDGGCSDGVEMEKTNLQRHCCGHGGGRSVGVKDEVVQTDGGGDSAGEKLGVFGDHKDR